MSSYLSYKRLLLFWRILLLPWPYICKQLVIASVQCNRKRKYASSPVCAIIESLEEYGMLSYVKNSIRNGSYCNIKEWKRLIRQKISESEVVPDNIWPWWQHASHYPHKTNICKTLFRLLCGIDCLGENVTMDRK